MPKPPGWRRRSPRSAVRAPAAPASTTVTIRLGRDGRVVERVSVQAAVDTANDLTLAYSRTEVFLSVRPDSERHLTAALPP